MEDYKENLKTYIKEDIIYQEYLKNKNKNFSDFDKFCIQHCKDIEELQQENQKYKEVIDKLKEWINIVQQNKDNKHLEPFISTDELDELLDILKEVEETDTNVGEVE